MTEAFFFTMKHFYIMLYIHSKCNVHRTVCFPARHPELLIGQFDKRPFRMSYAQWHGSQTATVLIGWSLLLSERYHWPSLQCGLLIGWAHSMKLSLAQSLMRAADWLSLLNVGRYHWLTLQCGLLIGWAHSTQSDTIGPGCNGGCWLAGHTLCGMLIG